MIDKTTDVSMWMLLAVCLGFLFGELCGDYNRRRKCLERENGELRDRLEAAAADSKPIQRALKEQRGVINDIHRRLLAVSKGLEKRLS
jgi:thiosulfate reductase cytochrome b subunit